MITHTLVVLVLFFCQRINYRQLSVQIDCPTNIGFDDALSRNLTVTTTVITKLTSETDVNSDLFTTSPAILFCRSSKYVYLPRTRCSYSAVFTALLLLLGGIEPNPGPATNQFLSIGCLNVRSIINKSAQLHSLVESNRLDVIAISETWTSSDDPPALLGNVAPDGFQVHHTSRSTSSPGRRGGGLAVLYRDNITLKVVHLNTSVTTFELQCVVLRFDRTACLLLNTYRPPHSAPTQTFFNELAELLVEASTYHSGPIILCGDVNCPGTTPGTINSNLDDLLHTVDFEQHVTVPTRDNNLLDIFASSRFKSPVKSVTVYPSHLISDHSLVKAITDLRTPPSTYSMRKWRDMRHIDYKALNRALLSSPLITNPAADVDQYTRDISRIVIEELDKIAPLQISKQVRRNLPSDRFLTAEARQSIRDRRRLERLWARTGDEVVRQQYRKMCRHTNKLINDSRTKFLSDRINSATDIPSRWRELKKLLHPSSLCAKGTNENPAHFSTKLHKFFVDKITKLQLENKTFLSNANIPRDPFMYDKYFSGSVFTEFTPVTPTEVLKLLDNIKLKFSPVDLFPSSLIKSCSSSFSVIIANLANLSFTQGKFPSAFKIAQITPILKKANGNPEEPNNYRPISNLNTISKIIERLALVRLSPSIVHSPNFNELQSAYRKLHSTETCTLKTLSDIYQTIDSGSAALAVSLDLSAAFDTVCHKTLLSRLENMFGLSGTVLNWVTSYLSDRSQFVTVDGHKSPVAQLTTGVPQGSVLGPLLFTSFTSPVSQLISSFNLSHQQYADDTQVYVSLSKTDPTASISLLQDCLMALRCWYAQNDLTINPSKSDAILLATAQRTKTLASQGLLEVSVAGCPVPLTNSLTTLGITLDSSLTLSKHVKTVACSSMFHVRALKHIRPLLSQQDSNTLASCLIQSKLDYLNSVLYNTSAANIQSLQRVQDAAARVVLKAPYRSSSSHLLSTLHWLPIQHRIKYKIASLTHTLLNQKQPAYLHDLLTPYTPARTLRSSDHHLLTIPRTHLRLCDQSFSVAAPMVWNSLPLSMRTNTSIKSFRSQLKTHLFTLAFPTR